MITTPDGIPLHNSMCTCSTHCANTCESGHCSGWCNCWCHEKKYAKINRAIIAAQETKDKEWAKLLLKNWNKAVILWNDGQLFSDIKQRKEYRETRQQEYARICCSWIIPNGMAEPHCVAEGL